MAVDWNGNEGDPAMRYQKRNEEFERSLLAGRIRQQLEGESFDRLVASIACNEEGVQIMPTDAAIEKASSIQRGGR